MSNQRVTDLEKFCLEQIWRPYQSKVGYEDRLERLPMSLEETAAKLREDSEWSGVVLDRVARIGFRFPSYIHHPLVDVIRAAPGIKVIEVKEDEG